MFDLITGKTKHMPSGGGVTVLLSSVLHLIVLGVIAIVPMLFVTDMLPDVRTMMAFVAAPPPVLAPPPPPPPPRLKDTPVKVVTSNVNTAPVEAPSRIDPEAARPTGEDDGTVVGDEGGIAGGIVGGLQAPPPLPPPPPPPAPLRAPRRVGGEIHPPVLLQRVEPIYPVLAMSARVEGMVILEAIIDEDGAVQA